MKRLSFILSFIVCICVANTNDVFSQKRELQQFKGKVTNQEGEPVPYVSIYVPGTGRETSSDMSGNFSIKAKHKETVYFRYIGMKDVQIQLDKNNPSEILVQIKPDTFRLDNVIEHSPDFPGGLSGLREYLKKSIQYPKKAFRAGEEGQVTIEFTIDPKGNVINAQVVKSVSAKLDKEALRIIESMPQWKPGMQRGRPVAVRMSVPIDFVIDQVYKAID